ncbi:MAG: NAD(P)H-dependent oxidoreductase [Anaerotignum propionicum]|uniref:flavodoxin family protein n=1 Tax=Anaerotignum propionicum TaxID=28446 RepID=UPI002B210FC9|nr:NAD(P)H-dependent oxidoreductase [Anaerotignum propionicum]MEA5057229.1 NAD(P)H-dependent oxidoreductase [Anaerotignum propionicum]
MKITVIYGTQRKSKSSTYNIAQQFIKCLSNGDSVSEFFLPKDMPKFCSGCWNCFTDSTKCPHYDYLKPITDAMDEAELLIFTAPVYVYHVPGQVKAFLDHFGYRWMPHQPNKNMFRKRALLISTAAGAGTKSTLRDLEDSMMFWGVARTYTFSKHVRAADWDTVDIKLKSKIQNDVKKLSNKIISESHNFTPSLKVKALFYAMKYMQIRFHYNSADVEYWKEHGWLGKEKPW